MPELIGAVTMIARASATSSVSSPGRSGPNRIALPPVAAWISCAAASGRKHRLGYPRLRTVVA